MAGILRPLVTSVLCLTMMLSTKKIQGQEVTPSPSLVITQTSHAGTSSISPTPTPLPQYTCRTGPDTQDFRHFIIRTNTIYLDISEPVSCSGFITRWHYCHYVIGFRNTLAGLRPCVWRRSNTSVEEFEVVGCNNITVVPGEGENTQCRSHDPTLDPDQVIFVEEGDYIGFYVPDSSLFPTLAPIDNDRQPLLFRSNTGFVSSFLESELENASCAGEVSCGRALLNAEIGI